MKKNLNKRIILYLSFIPYAFLLLICVCDIIFCFGNALNRIINDLGNLLATGWPVLILAICFAYQMHYLINAKGLKNGTDDEVDEADKLKIEKRERTCKIIYKISLICWGIYLILGVCAFPLLPLDEDSLLWVGEYGLEAIFGTLLLNAAILTVIPILPITAIYIIVYILSNRKKNKNCKNEEEQTRKE